MAPKTDALTPQLEARQLRFRYPEGWTLRAERFSAGPGEVVGLAGPNGAGKSTFLRLLGGLEVPGEGEVRLDGGPVDRRRVGFVFQRPVLYRGTAIENVAIGLRLRGRPDARARAQEWLERFEISRLASADVRTLSSGQVQRVALARALALEPDVLLLDEPFSNLDAVARRKWREELLGHARGRTAVVASHDPADFEGLAARVEVVADGLLLSADHPVARRWRAPG
jgi:ABC-type sulfate/molybdate transport systems ATPase subunit